MSVAAVEGLGVEHRGRGAPPLVSVLCGGGAGVSALAMPEKVPPCAEIAVIEGRRRRVMILFADGLERMRAALGRALAADEAEGGGAVMLLAAGVPFSRTEAEALAVLAETTLNRLGGK